MKINNLMMVIIGGAIAVLMVGTLLIPFVADYTDSTKEYYNNTFGPYAQVMDGDNVSIDITTTIGTPGTTTYIVGDYTLNVPQGPRALLIADNLTIYQNYSNGIAVCGVDSTNTQITFGTWSNVSISISGDTISIELSTDSLTKSYVCVCDWIFYRNNIGNYRMIDFISSSVTVYVNDLNQVYGSNLINTTGEYFSFNGTDVKIISTVDNVTTTRDTAASVTTTEVMNDVISFNVDSSRDTSSAFKFTTDNNGEDYDVYPFYMIVPASVYGITEDNLTINAMFSILPIIVIAGIITTVVYSVLVRK